MSADAYAPAAPAATSGLKALPAQLQLSDLRISVARTMAHGLPPIRLELSGNGQARFERQGHTAGFAFSQQQLLTAANELLALHFFSLPDKLPAVARLVIRPDGSVGRLMLPLTDTASTQVCLALPEGRKCVSYGRDAPAELESWVRAHLSEAAQRASKAEPEPKPQPPSGAAPK